MRTCPHCQFLVADGATSCSVCKNELPAPVPAGHPAQAFASPGQAPAGPTSGAAPFVPQHFGAPSGPPGFPPGTYASPGAPIPRSGPSTAKVLVIVASVIGVLALFGIGSLFLLGTTAEQAIRRIDLDPAELDWQVYDDPAGAFTVDMPGDPSENTIEVPESFGTVDEMQAVSVIHLKFNASVGVTADVVAAGATFGNVPFSPSSIERAVETLGGFEGAEVLSHEVVPGSGDLAMDLEVRGLVDGEEAVMVSRLVIVGSDIYEVDVAGPLDQREQLTQVFERMAASFTPTV